MGIVNIILMILGIVEPALAADGVIPQAYQGLAAGILSAITALKAELTNSAGQLTVNGATLLQAVASGVQILQANNILPASAAGLTLAFTTAAQAGLAAYQTAQAKVDPTLLAPLSPVAAAGSAAA